MTSLRTRILAALAVTLLCALLFELGCQIYAHFVVYPQLDVIRERTRHFYRASENPLFVYELRPDTDLQVDERHLHINRFGIREDSDDLFAGRRKIALLGDSVTFGLNHTQSETLSGRLQARLDPDASEIKVLNFSVPGYALPELEELLRVKNQIYDVTDVIYLLNLNDYSRRDSIYEGADNGTYRIYRRPLLMTPFFVRKAIYRYERGASFASPRWYRWMYEGNAELGRRHLRSMSEAMAARGATFGVVILPSGVSYQNGTYLLADIHAEIGSTLESLGVPYLSPVGELGRDVDAFFSNTDHFRPAGNEEMAKLLEAFVREGLRSEKK